VSKLQLEAKKQLAQKAGLVSTQQLEAKKQLSQKTELFGKAAAGGKEGVSQRHEIKLCPTGRSALGDAPSFRPSCATAVAGGEVECADGEA